MKTIEDVHSFMIEANPLKTIPSQRKVLEDMGRLTVESAYLIRDFTIDKSFCTSQVSRSLLVMR